MSKAARKKQVLRPGFLIHDVARLRRTVLDQRLKPLGITRAQIWILSNLSRHGGEGFSQVELARLLDMGKVTLGGLIDRLEDARFVERVPDKVDRRAKRVRMSSAGKALFEKMWSVAEKVNAEVMNGVSAEKQKIFLEVLIKMKENLIALDGVSTSIGRKTPAVAAPPSGAAPRPDMRHRKGSRAASGAAG